MSEPLTTEVANPAETTATTKPKRQRHGRLEMRNLFIQEHGQFKAGDKLPMVLNTNDMMRLFGYPSYRTFYRKVLEGEFKRFELRETENHRPLYSGIRVQRYLETLR